MWPIVNQKRYFIFKIVEIKLWSWQTWCIQVGYNISLMLWNWHVPKLNANHRQKVFYYNASEICFLFLHFSPFKKHRNPHRIICPYDFFLILYSNWLTLTKCFLTKMFLKMNFETSCIFYCIDRSTFTNQHTFKLNKISMMIFSSRMYANSIATNRFQLSWKYNIEEVHVQMLFPECCWSCLFSRYTSIFSFIVKLI